MSSTEVETKRVYDFSEGGRDMGDLLGGKGANVAEMTRLGLPVPKGFRLSTIPHGMAFLEFCSILMRRLHESNPRNAEPRFTEPVDSRCAPSWRDSEDASSSGAIEETFMNLECLSKYPADSQREQ